MGKSLVITSILFINLDHGCIKANMLFCKKVMIPTNTNRNRLCLIVKRNNSDSLPASPTAAQATAIDCGEIIFPVTPPDEFAAKASTGFIPIDSAVTFWRLANNTLLDVSEPVMNTPSQPRKGAKNGNRTEPVFASAKPSVVLIPEAFVT